MKKTTWIIIIIIAALALYLGSFYNGLVKKDQSVQAQWAQVENQFQRRFDLIPNLVNSVQGAMKQEQKVFGDLAEARTKYSGAQNVNDKVAAANEVQSSLARLLAVMENYPQLKSIDTVQTLMAQLESAENRIAVERGRFNDEVKLFNNSVKQFPGNLIAPIFGFSAKDYFESANGAETAPKVNL